MAHKDIGETIGLPLNEVRDALVEEVTNQVLKALREKGHDPAGQMAGYLMSGDPTYITSHKDARVLIQKVERDEVLRFLVDHYMSTTRRP